MRILLIATQSPAPPHGGAALRTLGWIRTARRFAEIGLVCLTRSQREKEELEKLAQDEGLFLRTVLSPRRLPSRARDAAQSLFGAHPYTVQSAISGAMYRATETALREFRPHRVQAELLTAAPYLAAARDLEIPTIYSAHNVESRILSDDPRRRWNPWLGLMARKTLATETKWAYAADALIAVSDAEAAILAPAGSRVLVLPNAIESERYRFVPPERRTGSDILFTGHLAYPPNRDAARRLAREILPRVLRAVPDARCILAGASPARAVRSLAGPGLEVVADFEHSSRLFESAAVFVSPLGWGAGSRLKLLEAAASGLPIVATPFSAEGLALEPGRDYVSAQTPHELAASAIRLLEDSERSRKMAWSARAAVEKHHDWTGSTEIMHDFYEGLAGHDGQERGRDTSGADRGRPAAKPAAR